MLCGCKECDRGNSDPNLQPISLKWKFILTWNTHIITNCTVYFTTLLNTVHTVCTIYLPKNAWQLTSICWANILYWSYSPLVNNLTLRDARLHCTVCTMIFFYYCKSILIKMVYAVKTVICFRVLHSTQGVK